MTDIDGFIGTDVPESDLAKALKKCTIVRRRKFYPLLEVQEMWLSVKDDMLAWVVDLEDRAICEAMARAIDYGKIDAGILLDKDAVEKVLRKQIPVEAYGFCPACHKPINPDVYTHYCGYCGQAIKWII